MAFVEFLTVVCGSVMVVVAIGMCAKCRRGRSGQANFTDTSAKTTANKGTTADNTTSIAMTTD